MIKFLVNKEIVKGFILFVLIFASIFQIGVLWGYQNNMFPVNIMNTVFGKNDHVYIQDIDEKRNDFFTPKSIVVTEGYDCNCWKLNQDSENFKRIKKESEKYLIDILSSTNILNEIQSLKPDQWIEMINPRCFIIEYDTVFEQNTARLFLNLTKTSARVPENIYKLAIAPWDNELNGSSSEICIYLYDQKSLYRIILPVREGYMKRSDYAEIFNNCKTDKKTVKECALANKFFYADSFRVNNELTIIERENICNNYDFLTANIPKKLQKIEEVEKYLLGKGESNYVTYPGIDKSFVFRSIDDLSGW